MKNEMSPQMREMLSGLRHIALDMDGTIYLGKVLFPFTLPFLEKLGRMGITYSFLTNNPTSSIDDYVAKLLRMGVPCTPEQMYTTTTATIDYIKTHYPEARKLFLLGTPSMIGQFEQAGFYSCADSPDDVPDVVVAAFDKTLVYSRLCRCAWWISRGLPYIATNPDWVCPTDEPTILVDCGSICACLEAAAGRKPDVVIGKPNPDILLGVAGHMGLEPGQIAMVGDRIYTDVQTALNAGACGVLVLSGETTLQTALSASNPPSLICRDLEEFGELLEQARSQD
ncbi:MAG: HAD-IIA family hydrolase [Bacteroidales bacterium]|nr:HAD-IIA family hydrolase [Bacteroidales bacterium]